MPKNGSGGWQNVYFIALSSRLINKYIKDEIPDLINNELDHKDDVNDKGDNNNINNTKNSIEDDGSWILQSTLT